MKAGLHASVRNGFLNALLWAEKSGCESVQIFSQNPRGWRTRVYHEREFSEFRDRLKESPVQSVVVHSPYLPNLCSSDEDLYQKSLLQLKGDLERSGRLAADGLVIHPGGYSEGKTREEGLSRLTAALAGALKEVDNGVPILIENMAGGGRRIGGDFQEIKEIFSAVRSSGRLGLCFDTCHAFAAGYDLSTHQGVKKTISELDKTVGLDSVKVFHVNDSRDGLRSRLDRHESLGKGKIGLKGLKAFLGQPVFQDRIFILETPRENEGEDLDNLRILKEFGRSGLSHSAGA